MSSPENSAPPQSYPATAAILVLLTLTGVMLLALFSRTAPHPPLEAPSFALGPFLAASLAIGAAAFHLLRQGVRYGSTLAVLFALSALVSFGPQKYFDPEFSRIWPAVIIAQVAVIAILAWSLAALTRGRATS
jgi:hypothetical protein